MYNNEINIINTTNTPSINIYVIILSSMLLDVIPNLFALDGIF